MPAGDNKLSEWLNDYGCKTELYCSKCNTTYQCTNSNKPNYIPGPCLHLCPKCPWTPLADMNIKFKVDTEFTEQVTMVDNPFEWKELEYNG